MEEIAEPMGKDFRALRRLEGVAQRHLLKRKEKIRPRLAPDGAGCDLSRLVEELLEGFSGKQIEPLLVSMLFVAAFPIEIGLVGEAFLEIAKKFPARASGAGAGVGFWDYFPIHSTGRSRLRCRVVWSNRRRPAANGKTRLERDHRPPMALENSDLADSERVHLFRQTLEFFALLHV